MGPLPHHTVSLTHFLGLESLKHGSQDKAQHPSLWVHALHLKRTFRDLALRWLLPTPDECVIRVTPAHMQVKVMLE